MGHMFLYHGSPNHIDFIKTHKSTHKVSAVYATPFYEFAMCYAGKHWCDLDINQSVYNDKIILTEIYPNAFKIFFDCPGYIYYLKPDNFKPLENNGTYEYISMNDVTPVRIDTIDNVLSELRKRRNVALYNYPNLPPYIKDRWKYIEEKGKMFHMDIQKLKSDMIKKGLPVPPIKYDT